MEEKTGLLSEAARAIEAAEARQAAKLTVLKQQLDRERQDTGRQQAELNLR